MSLFTAKGNEAKKSAQKTGVDLKTAYIRLKENESVRVRLLGTTDYVEYMGHGDFNLGIYNQPCITPMTGEKDPMCVAAESGVEGYERLKSKKRYIFAFWDIDKKQIRYWDASKTQAKKLIAGIEEYAENIAEIAFTFKRTGDKKETVYSLLPILKLNAEGQEGFDEGMSVKIEMANYESVLIARSPEQQIEALKLSGFPVEDFFDVAPTIEDDLPNEQIDYSVDENPTSDF